MSRQKEAVIAFCNDGAPEGVNSNCKDLIFDLFHILTWVVFFRWFTPGQVYKNSEKWPNNLETELQF